MAETGKYDQKVADDGFAIQSGRDTTINQGVSPGDMKQIIEAIAGQLPAYAAMAAEIVEARLKDFERRVLERFSNPTSARSDAFKDPDFQYLLGRAQHAYARSGNETVGDTLIQLIAERSKQSDRNRLALSLNEAVEKSAVLTKNEFAELSLVYLLNYTINHAIGNLDFLAGYLTTFVVPLLKDISEANTSYTYLEAQSCANIITISTVDLGIVLRSNYGGVFGKGFDLKLLHDSLPNDQKGVFDNSSLVIPCLNDNSKLQFKALNRAAFIEVARPLGAADEVLNNVWNMFENTMWSNPEIVTNLSPRVPEIAELFRLWSSTPLKHMTLTSVGLAIGHANLVRVAGFSADLSIWIQ